MTEQTARGLTYADLPGNKRHRSSMNKMRLDQLLVERALFATREQAQRAIMAGEVRVDEQIAAKPSFLVTADTHVAVAARPRFVSRGGLKLEGALEHFRVDVAATVAADIGASTGGFTDCLLQHGAARVYAIDVGHGQLAWKLRNDARVLLLEKTNARTLQASDLPEPVQICVVDVSFISLTLILPRVLPLLETGGSLLALIKPQFELERRDVGGGGVVRDPTLHGKAQAKILRLLETELGQEVLGVAPSVITGTDGNREFFICARKR